MIDYVETQSWGLVGIQAIHILETSLHKLHSMFGLWSTKTLEGPFKYIHADEINL